MTDDNRLDEIRTSLTGLGRDAEVQELFAYIGELEQRVQQYEHSLPPELEGLTWTRQVRDEDTANRPIGQNER